MSAQVFGGKQALFLEQLLGPGIQAAHWEEAISRSWRTEQERRSGFCVDREDGPGFRGPCSAPDPADLLYDLGNLLIFSGPHSRHLRHEGCGCDD